MDFFVPILVLYVPLLVICGLYFWIGGYAQRPGLRKILQLSAAIPFVILALIYAFVLVAAGICTGNILYGYVDCGPLPTEIADASLALFLFTTLAAILFGTVVALICGVLEWRFRRR